MAMTLGLTQEEPDAWSERVALDGTSMQEVVRQAVREYIARVGYRDSASAAAQLITQRHADVLRRMGE